MTAQYELLSPARAKLNQRCPDLGLGNSPGHLHNQKREQRRGLTACRTCAPSAVSATY
jgi:hypothetical protein